MSPAGRPAPAAGRSRPRRALRRTGGPLLFISPFFVLFATFSLYPLAFSAWLSLRDWSLTGPARWVGLANYRALFHDALFWQSMENAALLFLIYVPAMTFLALVLASLLNSRYVRLQGFWRTLIFLPYIMSGTVAAAFTFQLMLDRNAGYANKFLSFIGVSPVPWLDNTWWARISLGLLVLWAWLGYNMLILLAGLQAIPPELAEAARVAGAGPVRIFWHITVPLLLTNGGPANATTTPVLQIWQNTFSFLRVGYSAAMSWIYFAVIVVLALTQYFLVSRRDRYLEARR